MGRESFLGPAGASYALGLHETGHLVSSHVEPILLGYMGELAASIDGVVVLGQPHQLWPKFQIALFTLRRWSRLRLVVGGGGDLELFQDRVDSPANPTSCFLLAGLDVDDYYTDRRSSSAPKKADADCRIALARRSSRTSFRSSFSSASWVLVRPPRVPASISARFTQMRSDSLPTPSCRDTRLITP